jgi:hypothetical protein
MYESISSTRDRGSPERADADDADRAPASIAASTNTAVIHRFPVASDRYALAFPIRNSLVTRSAIVSLVPDGKLNSAAAVLRP